MRKRSVPVLLPTFLVLGLLGIWAGTSMGQLPPTPPPPVTLPTVTVTVPPVPLPPPPPVTTPTVSVPSTPKPPIDPPKAPVPLPVTVPGTNLPGTPAQAGQPSTSAPPSGGAPGSAAPGQQFGASSRIATISRVRVSRPWITTAHGVLPGRAVWITFWLSGPGTVVFFVDELAPECRYVGKFLVRGRSGRNEVRFRGLVQGQTLDSGTYRLTAHPRGNRARRLTGVTIVMLEHPPGPAEIEAARARNTCPQGIPASVRDSTLGGESMIASPTSGVAGVQATSLTSRPFEDESAGPFATAVESIQSAADAVPPVLFALAALAIMLLALAALPQPVRASRAGAALVHHRGTLALTGVGVLVAAVLSFAVL